MVQHEAVAGGGFLRNIKKLSSEPPQSHLKDLEWPCLKKDEGGVHVAWKKKVVAQIPLYHATGSEA